jgi:hypothetical protein
VTPSTRKALEPQDSRNLPAKPTLVTTPPIDRAHRAVLEERVRRLTAALREDTPVEGSLLGRVKGALVLGRLSYYVYLVCCALVLAGVWLSAGDFSVLHPWRSLAGPPRLGLLSVLTPGPAAAA